MLEAPKVPMSRLDRFLLGSKKHKAREYYKLDAMNLGMEATNEKDPQLKHEKLTKAVKQVAQAFRGFKGSFDTLVPLDGCFKVRELVTNPRNPILPGLLKVFRPPQ